MCAAARSQIKADVDAPRYLARIAALLDGQVWDTATLDAIAALLRDAGYRIEEVTG